MTLLETLGEKGLKDFNEILKNTQIADIPRSNLGADNVDEKENKIYNSNQKINYYRK